MIRQLKERFWVWGCCLIAASSTWSCTNGTERQYREGAQLYQTHCSNCHMEDGTGLEALYPPLAKADWLQQVDVGAACIIRNGMEDPIVVNGIRYEMPMPPQPQLSAVEITNILNYIHNAWGNKREQYISLPEVEAALQGCKPEE